MFSTIFSNNKLLLLIGGTVLLLFIILFFSLFRGITTAPKETTYTVFPTNYPTLSMSQTEDVTVTKVFPQNKATRISVMTGLEVTFSRTLTKEEQGTIQVGITPQIGITQQWDSEAKILTIIPSSPLQNNQPYTVRLASSLISTSWNFTTTDAPLQQDLQESQSQADKNFADEQEALRNKYPWIDKLPLQTSTYFTYFDTDESKLIAKVYPTTNSDAEISDIQKEVLTQLQNIGVAVETFPVQWTITRP